MRTADDLQLKTGDVLACYGPGWISRIISRFTPRLRVWKLAPSHVAIVAWHDTGEGTPIEAWVHESTTLSKHKDGLSGDNRKGVQAHRFSTWLAAQQGSVDLYRLKVPMTRPEKTVEYLLEVHARKIGYSLLRAFHTASPVRNTEGGEYLVCSELVSYALQKGGSIGTHVRSYEATPWDVTTYPCFRKPVRLKKAGE